MAILATKIPPIQKMTKNLPTNLCSPAALGMIKQDIGSKEENLIVNICKIKKSSDEVLKKFKDVTDAQKANVPIDVHSEVKYHNTRLSKIQNIAQASQIRLQRL